MISGRDVVPAERGRPEQRRNAESLGADPVIQRAIAALDVGITVARLNTDHEHLRTFCVPATADAPEGLRRALSNGNALQDIVLEEIRPGRTATSPRSSRARMQARKTTAAFIRIHRPPRPRRGPLIGLWDYQDGCQDAATHRSSRACGVDRVASDDACARVGWSGSTDAAGEDAIIGWTERCVGPCAGRTSCSWFDRTSMPVPSSQLLGVSVCFGERTQVTSVELTGCRIP